MSKPVVGVIGNAQVVNDRHNVQLVGQRNMRAIAEVAGALPLMFAGTPDITGLPTTSPGHNGPITSHSFEIKFFPKESSAELESGKTERITIDLDPVPARIEGRLFA